MSNWYQPPDLQYSFKSRFAWPTAAAGAEAAAGTAANTAGTMASAPPPHHPFHHGHGYGRGYYYRPRFGLFRRMVWFGLGVGAASWYIHRNDPRNHFGRCISERESSHIPQKPVSTHLNPDTNQSDWRERWRYLQDHRAELARPMPPVPAGSAPTSVETSQVIASLPIDNSPREEQSHKWGWGARREERRRRREEAQATKVVESEVRTGGEDSEEVRKIKEAVDKIWAERKQAAVDIQATANEKAKEYARIKLETLSQAVDTLRDALKADAEKATHPKLV